MNETPEDGPPASPYSEPSEAAGPSEEPSVRPPRAGRRGLPKLPAPWPAPFAKEWPRAHRGTWHGSIAKAWRRARRGIWRVAVAVAEESMAPAWPRATGCCWTRQLPAGRVGEASSSSASRTRAFWPSNAWPLARATSCASRPGFCTSVRTRPGCSATTEPSLSTRATTAPCHSRPWLGGRGSATGRRGG